MSMRALIRIWAVMTGSAWKPSVNWQNREKLELATYSMDLELGLTFQFYGILMFAFLMTSFLKHSKYVKSQNEAEAARYMSTLAYASIQGVYAFILVGVARSIFDFVMTYLETKPRFQVMAEHV